MRILNKESWFFNSLRQLLGIQCTSARPCYDYSQSGITNDQIRKVIRKKLLMYRFILSVTPPEVFSRYTKYLVI